MKQEIIEKWYSITRRIPLYWLLIIVLIGVIPFNLYINHFNNPIAHNEEPIENCSLPYNLLRSNYNNKLDRPLLYAKLVEEDNNLMPLKDKINDYINGKKGPVLKSASVYFNILDSANGWFSINPDERYSIASLLKVAFMTALLKDVEDNPSLLNKKIHFNEHTGPAMSQDIIKNHLKFGEYYTLKELLKYAICYSDNDAGYLICDACKESTYKKLFSDLQLPPDDLTQDYLCSVEEYARLFRVLYNASFLSNDMSEYALELLSNSDFNDGIVKHLDKNLVVARKFGERGIDATRELHEYAIVYLHNRPYLLGIMTRGKDYKQLEDVISDISLMVYNEMKKGSVQ